MFLKHIAQASSILNFTLKGSLVWKRLIIQKINEAQNLRYWPFNFVNFFIFMFHQLNDTLILSGDFFQNHVYFFIC